VKSRPAQSGHHVGRPAHNVPNQTGTVVLDHEDHWTLVDAEMVGSDPVVGRTIRHFIGLVERRLEAVALLGTELELGHRADRRDYDLRGERQRRDNYPRSDRAVIGTIGCPASVIAVKLPLDPVHGPFVPIGAIGCCNSPTEFPVARELQRVADRVLSMNIRCLPAVLEVVGAMLAHESVAQIAEIDPQVRELVREERTGVEELLSREL